MSFSGNRRLRRPVIEPIQTAPINILDRSNRFLGRRTSPLSGDISPAIDSRDSHVSGFAHTTGEIRQTLKKLYIPETTSDKVTFRDPSFKSTYVEQYVRRSIVVESPSSARGHHLPGGRSDTLSPCSPCTVHMSFSVTLSASSTPTSPSCESDVRRMQLADIQRSRLALWEQGPKRFGCLEDADVFVRPLPFRRCGEEVGSLSKDIDMSFSAPSSPFPSPILSSPTLVLPRRLSVRAIVHSKSHAPIGLKRDFDLDALRATIPDPLPSPRSPNFNPKALLSNLGPLSRKRRASSSPDSVAVDASDNEDEEETASSRPNKRHRFSVQPIAVPINVQYARAHLPALAAIMMSDRVQRGDTIELAVPHPQAWPETVAYVYTGEAQLLTEQTKENILHLGGKI